MTLVSCMITGDARYLELVATFLPFSFVVEMFSPNKVCWNDETERWEPKSGILRALMTEDDFNQLHDYHAEWLEENEGITDPTGPGATKNWYEKLQESIKNYFMGTWCPREPICLPVWAWWGIGIGIIFTIWWFKP